MSDVRVDGLAPGTASDDPGTDWLVGYLNKCHRALGLHSWGATVRFREYPREDKPDADAAVDIDYRYLNVVYTFRRGMMTERPAAKVLACHEALHVAWKYATEAEEMALNLLYPRRRHRARKEIFLEALSRAEDHAISRASASLARVIDAWDGDDAGEWGWPTVDPDDREVDAA